MHAHIVFNLVLVLAGLPIAGRAHAMMLALLLARIPATPDLSPVSALDDSVIDTPSLAFANVTREVVGICETVETMLGTVMELYGEPDRMRIEALRGLDDRIDQRHHNIKLYLARIAALDLGPAEAQRMQELLSACIKLEQVGDIITRNLLAHVKRKHDRGLAFSADGWDELTALHAALVANARMAFNVVVTRDRETALQLVRAKDQFRETERRANALHFDRLRDGGARSIDTSSLHLDTIRDLKQINSLLAALAYPVLEQQGLLLGSRLSMPEACPA